jgi:hypothetical protein
MNVLVERFEILAGLPPYGAVALPFPSDGIGRHREGLVVRFDRASVEPWVGNFQRGATTYDSVLAHPDGQQLVVVAGGQGYVFDPEMRSETQCLMPQAINFAISMPEFNQIVLGNGLEFGAIRVDGTGWNSGRLSWMVLEIFQFQPLRSQARLIRQWGTHGLHSPLTCQVAKAPARSILRNSREQFLSTEKLAELIPFNFRNGSMPSKKV